MSAKRMSMEFALFLAQQPPQWARASSFLRFLDHTQRRTTVGRTSLDKWSARRGDLYLTTHDTHNRKTSMVPGGIRTHDLSRRAAADLRLRPRGHWDRHEYGILVDNTESVVNKMVNKRKVSQVLTIIHKEVDSLVILVNREKNCNFMNLARS